ncbi:MAG TPA: hypothetical protein VK899_09915 [Gemmatimonadales bacterium]|jgi:hypothetical protein|nr:hypothetical protein [Gemmatimonadales bacterium]
MAGGLFQAGTVEQNGRFEVRPTETGGGEMLVDGLREHATTDGAGSGR